MIIYDDSKLVDIYFDCDEFCKKFQLWLTLEGLELPNPNNSRMSDSELMTILMVYHLSGLKCFKYFYQSVILGPMHKEFPEALSYNRFIEVLSCVGLHMMAYVNVWKQGRLTGVYLLDSFKLVVCHNARIHSHKVFDGIAQRGKGSMGWFFGLKMHLIINQYGEVIRALLSSGNKSDMNLLILEQLCKRLKGKIWADRGYASWKAFNLLWKQGLKLIFRFKKNMKNALMELEEKIILKKRSLIETVIHLLKNICNVEHSRHRSPDNAFTHIFAALAAYAHWNKKPCINFKAFKLIEN